MTVTATPVTNTNPSNTTTTANSTVTGLANNFQTFLTMLTTQLRNQNPLDPMDTNQFTQQLVQFAQVEQQLKANEQLTTLVSLQKSAANTEAMAYVGRTVAIDGSQASLTNGAASWGINASQAANATITITNAAGQTVFSKDYSVNSGEATFSWDGKGSDGVQYPDGTYKLSVTAKDSNGQSVGISTEILGTVDSVDLTQSPPLLSVAGQSYTADKIKRVVNPTKSGTGTTTG
ncbi:flagellar hook assembly protein FlgD [Bradyrhizobium sp. WD16]|uniref:flagellar hook assembly protein FlgD n=1 Tax=Bradyrhizobium sp. WD16 TaxID=1521768 RepID=UPI0020A41B11|nr:flagellar hook capping FlgD N-terminal domain-containing protein [Bradyrhizobium sp. WD16]UTD27930.1 flagellar biosynthesis protein FlgD [Bradyrhizobium sp. WD16]